MKGKPAKTGRARKDELMPRAKQIASAGDCLTWRDVLAKMGDDGISLKLWAGADDVDALNRLCRQGSLRRQLGLPPGVKPRPRRREK